LPALTAERFVSSPFIEGDRLFRTGDLGRLMPNGAIALHGRRDQQVKVRGFRIELGEVEAAVEAHPDVREAAVQPRAIDSGQIQLIAYYCALRPCDPEAVRRFVAAKLPDFMVPSAFVELAALPLTPAGKVDRRGLPAPEARKLPAPVCDPADPETIVTMIVRDALGAGTLSPSEPLAGRGLDSFGMSGILVGIEDAFGIRIRQADILPELFESVASLTRYVRANRGAAP
jgi:acyl carrier protein